MAESLFVPPDDHQQNRNGQSQSKGRNTAKRTRSLAQATSEGEDGIEASNNLGEPTPTQQPAEEQILGPAASPASGRERVTENRESAAAPPVADAGDHASHATVEYEDEDENNTAIASDVESDEVVAIEIRLKQIPPPKPKRQVPDLALDGKIVVAIDL